MPITIVRSMPAPVALGPGPVVPFDVDDPGAADSGSPVSTSDGLADAAGSPEAAATGPGDPTDPGIGLAVDPALEAAGTGVADGGGFEAPGGEVVLGVGATDGRNVGDGVGTTGCTKTAVVETSVEEVSVRLQIGPWPAQAPVQDENSQPVFEVVLSENIELVAK